MSYSETIPNGGCETPCPRGSTGQRGRDGRCRCQACREVTRLRKQRWLDRNPEKKAAYSTKWRQNNRDSRIASVNKWRAANREKTRQAVLRAGAKWAKANSHKRAASRAKQRAIRISAVAAWADFDAIAAFYAEAAAKTKATGIWHEVDHIVPLRNKHVCGLHVETNLQVVTRTDNRRKASKMNE